MVAMRKLPFLNGIRAFEAAARAASFAKAADELHVTPAAISRMVQLLEQRLGFQLFERKANRLVLTPAGLRDQWRVFFRRRADFINIACLTG